MPWQSLGVVTVGEDWKSFPTVAIDVETFRLTHQTVVDPAINSAWLAQYFPLPEPGGRRVPWRRLYPSSEPQILELPIPPDFRKQSILVFDVQVRWKLPYYPVAWQIHLEALL